MKHIVGQDAALTSLKNQLCSNRVHHAQLFHGPRGVGKFTAAVSMARVLLCQDRQAADSACGHCVSCRMIPEKIENETAMTTAHPDLHVVVKELALYSADRQVRSRKLLSIPVDVLREHLLEPAHHTSQHGHGKVFILDEAELLNPAGQNALLKTLEEPPPNTWLILVTSRENHLLATIRSRCQRTAFGPLDASHVAAVLHREAPALGLDDREFLVKFSMGSIGRALMGLNMGLREWRVSVWDALQAVADGRSASTLGSDMAERVDALASNWVSQHDNASKEASTRMAGELMLSVVSEWARQGMVIINSNCEGLQPPQHLAQVRPWLDTIAACEEARVQLSANVNSRSVMNGLVGRVVGAFRL